MRTLNHSNAKTEVEEAKQTALDLNKTIDLNITLLKKIKVKFNGSSGKAILKKRKKNES